ncbi:MAG TPA: hypothetical protein VF516_00200 [Kofleriaceae bacterium]
MANKLAYQVIMGAGSLYSGLYQATEPLDQAVNTSPQASAWVDAGFTNDGVTITLNQEFATMTVDQISDIIGRKMTQRDVQVKANLAEATLENLTIGLNSGTISTGSGGGVNYKVYTPVFNGSELQPTYFASIFDGYAPASAAGLTKRRRFILRRVLSIDNVEVAYKKGDMTLVPVTFGCHYIDTVTAPFKIVDET